MLLKFSKTGNVKNPQRAHATDAGIDFCCPPISEIKDAINSNSANSGITLTNNSIVIPPGRNAVIPSNIRVEIPYGYMGLFLNKSGVASKNDALIGAQVIDCFYSGIVHVDLHNVGTDDLVIEEGSKLSQMVIIPVLSCDLTEVDEDMLYDWMISDKNRGDAGFGSTGK